MPHYRNREAGTFSDEKSPFKNDSKNDFDADNAFEDRRKLGGSLAPARDSDDIQLNDNIDFHNIVVGGKPKDEDEEDDGVKEADDSAEGFEQFDNDEFAQNAQMIGQPAAGLSRHARPQTGHINRRKAGLQQMAG